MQASGSVRESAARGKCQVADKFTSSGILTRLAMPTCDVEAWLARLDADDGHISHCNHLLSVDEQHRASTLRHKPDRRRYIVTRGTLRLLLGHSLEADPATLEFSYTPRGKPYFAGRANTIHFNVSHSAERALYALSLTNPVGADIECLEREVDYRRLARRFFTPREQTALLRIPEGQRRREFLACWTRKEAVAKASGDGLALPFTQFEVPVAPISTSYAVGLGASVPAAVCTLYPVVPGSGYVASVAAWRARHPGGPQPERI
jgi:4'-phosphopantetheinyl transferase